MASRSIAATQAAAGSETSRLRVLAAFAAVYVIWGSTYLAIRFAIATLPPFVMAGTRFLVAGALLYGWARARGVASPTRAQWGAAAVIGTLLLLLGNGGVVWAEQTVPSGLTALLVAMVPLWMVLLDWLRPGGSRPAGMVLVGVAVGFAGMAVLVGPGQLAGGGHMSLVGIAAAGLAALSWAAGSLYGRRAPLPASPLLATSLEMLVGGALLFLAGIPAGEWANLHLTHVSALSLLSLGYLIVGGSLVAFTAYVWLLRVSTPARASTYAYVNPLVAVVLGWAFGGEALGPRTLAATAIIVAAVVVITTAQARPSPAVAGEPEPEPTACASPSEPATHASA